MRSAGRTDTVEDVVASYDGERVVLVAGTDAAYDEWGADVITALRAEGATWIVLAGHPVPVVAELIADELGRPVRVGEVEAFTALAQRYRTVP